MDPRESDPDEYAAQMKDRLREIRENPEQALFSEFKGTVGGVTVWVDMMGRLKRLHLDPGTANEGIEPRLVNDIMQAYHAAHRAANKLDFNLADFAQELENALTLKSAVTDKVTSRSATADSRTPRQPDDEEEDVNSSTSWLR